MPVDPIEQRLSGRRLDLPVQMITDAADLLDEEPHGQDLLAARGVLELICAAYASAGAGGVEVALPFEGDRSLTPMQHWRR